LVRSNGVLGNDVRAFVAGSTPDTLFTFNSGLSPLSTYTGLGFGVASDMLAINAGQAIVSGSAGVRFLNLNSDGAVNPNGTGLLPLANAGALAFDANGGRNLLFVAQPGEGLVDIYAGAFTDTSAGIGNVRLVQTIVVGGRVSGLERFPE
jgi:hypothetical protein